MVGDPSKAKLKLGWTPKITLEELIQEMIDEDMKCALKELNLSKEGFSIPNKFESPPSSIN